MSQSDAFQPAPLDESGEEAVEIGEWHGAASLAEELMQKHWGDERAKRLAAHHRIVTNLISQQNWPVVRKYDICVRRKAASDSKHDLATLDSVHLSLVIAEVGQARQSLANSWPYSANETSAIAGTSHWSGAGSGHELPTKEETDHRSSRDRRSAFGAGPQVTFKPPAKQRPPQRVNPVRVSPSETECPRSSTPKDRNSVSIGREEKHDASTVPDVPISTHAACATPKIMA